MAEQCLPKVKAFSAPHTSPPMDKLGVHKKLGGDTTRSTDPYRSEGYSVLNDVMLSI